MSIPAAGDSADIQLQQLAVLMTRLVSGGVGLAVASTAAVDLTLTQFRALAIIEEHAPMRLTDLARRLGVSPSSATQTCDRLVRASLVERSRAVSDQRVAQLTLSVDGRALVAEVRAVRHHQAGEILAHVPQERRARVLSSLADLAAAVGEPSEEHTMFGWT